MWDNPTEKCNPTCIRPMPIISSLFPRRAISQDNVICSSIIWPIGETHQKGRCYINVRWYVCLAGRNVSHMSQLCFTDLYHGAIVLRLILPDCQHNLMLQFYDCITQAHPSGYHDRRAYSRHLTAFQHSDSLLPAWTAAILPQAQSP